MTTNDPSPNAFPFASKEFALVGDTADARYPSFDISQPDTFVDNTLHAHIDMGTAHAQEEAEVVQYEGPVPIVDPLSTAMQTYHYVNQTKDKSICSYLSLYHVKRQITKAILECIDLWNEQKRHPTFKIGIEVKAVFTKNHPNIQNLEMPSLTEHQIMFIHRILQKIVVGHLEQVDLEAFGSLISSIEWQCLDENHNQDSAHVLYNIFEFQIHIYSANAMQAGGGWIPFQVQIHGIKAVINPRNEDDYCFVYMVQLSLVDFSLKPNCQQIACLQRLVREQGIFINCSLEMPVELTEKKL